MPEVVLRLVDDADYDELAGFVALLDAAEPTVPAEGTPNRAHARGKLDNLRRDKSVVLRVILLNGEIVGGIIATDTGRIPQVRFLVAAAYRNQGIATAALIAFTATMTRRPLQAEVSATNAAAIRVLEKAGFAPPARADDATGTIRYELGFFPAATAIGITAS